MTQCTQEEALTANQDCIPEAVAEVFSTTCGVAVKAIEMTSGPGSKIVSVISLVGDAELAVFIGLPKGTAPVLVAKFAGFDVPYESPDMGDAVGEVANTLAGVMKNLLDAKGVKVNISLPTVIRAENIQVLLQRGGQSIKIGLRSDVGPLWVGVATAKGGGFVA